MDDAYEATEENRNVLGLLKSWVNEYADKQGLQPRDVLREAGVNIGYLVKAYRESGELALGGRGIIRIGRTCQRSDGEILRALILLENEKGSDVRHLLGRKGMPDGTGPVHSSFGIINRWLDEYAQAHGISSNDALEMASYSSAGLASGKRRGGLSGIMILDIGRFTGRSDREILEALVISEQEHGRGHQPVPRTAWADLQTGRSFADKVSKEREPVTDALEGVGR